MTRTQFDNQLKQLNNELIEMGSMIEHAIQTSISALVTKDIEKAQSVVEYDSDIDHQERSVESLCMKLLLMQQPVASDLRLISAAFKMITDMERIGDQAADIADIAIQLITDKAAMNHELIGKMANETMVMVVKSIEAFVSRDIELANKVIASDDIVDDLFDQVKAEMVTAINSNAEAGMQSTDYLMIAKYFERIGDHATNIAEWVIYAITGEHEDEVK